jgi:hypothetical protein
VRVGIAGQTRIVNPPGIFEIVDGGGNSGW